MPMPVSITSTFISLTLPVTLTLITPLSGVNLIALINKLVITCCKRIPEALIWGNDLDTETLSTIFFSLAVFTKFTALYFLPIFLVRQDDKNSIKQMIFYSLFSIALVGTVFTFQSQNVLYGHYQTRVSFSSILQLSHWSEVYAVVNTTLLFNLLVITLLPLTLSCRFSINHSLKPFFLTIFTVMKILQNIKNSASVV